MSVADPFVSVTSSVNINSSVDVELGVVNVGPEEVADDNETEVPESWVQE